MPLPTPNHCFTTSGGFEVLTHTRIIKKCGVKTSSEGAGTLYPENPFGVSSPTLLNYLNTTTIYIYIYI